MFRVKTKPVVTGIEFTEEEIQRVVGIFKLAQRYIDIHRPSEGSLHTVDEFTFGEVISMQHLLQEVIDALGE